VEDTASEKMFLAIAKTFTTDIAMQDLMLKDTPFLKHLSKGNT
jgi:hypothetical protein